MISFKTVLHIVTLVLALAIGPIGNRGLWFGDSPEQLYGETLVFEDEGEVWSLVKNGTSDEVSLVGPDRGRVLTWSLKGSYSPGWTTGGTVGPESLGLLVRDLSATKGSKVRVRIGDGVPTTPRSLRIATVGERQRSFLVFVLLLALAAYLTCSVTGYYWQFAPQEWPE